MKASWIGIGLAILAAIVTGCTTPAPARELDAGAPAGGAAETPPVQAPDVPEGAQPLVDQALADLTRRLGNKADAIALLSVEETDFPDASLGVPEADKMYAQVITPGYVIRLAEGDQVYTYHGAGERVVLAPEPASSGKP